MAITTEMIKQLRELTQAGVLDCKKALEQNDGDFEKATEYLKQKGLASAAKKADRAAVDGRVEAYIHPGDKLAALVEINCETDFVALTETFRSFCHDVAMQVAATAPRWVSREDVSPAELAELKAEYAQQAADENKPANIVERIVEGKLAKFFGETCLLEQAYIKDDSKTVQQLLTEMIAKLGENIKIARFARFQITN
jgi:elongation factor Ts